MQLRAATLALAALLFAGPASADSDPLTPVREWGVQLGGGNSSATDVQYYAIQPYLGIPLWQPLDRWLVDHALHALWMIEPWLAYVRDRKGPSRGDGVEVGLSPVILRLAVGDWRLKPYIEGGVGGLYTSLRSDIRGTTDLGQSFQFSSTGGAGLRYEFDASRALTLGVRFRHISNAGMDHDNPGIDTVYGLVGLVFH